VLLATTLPRRVVHRPPCGATVLRRRNRRQANRQQVIADLFGIVDPVAARRAVQLVQHDAPARASSPSHAQGDDLGLTSRRKQRGPRGRITAVVKIASPVWRSASSMGAGRRQWMPEMLASSLTCSVEGLMDDLA
jgi:hypothetical protein